MSNASEKLAAAAVVATPTVASVPPDAYPLTGLPAWLTVLTRLDPLTYVVGPMRHLVFSHLNVSPQLAAILNTRLAPSITWAGWAVPVWLSLGIVAVMGLVMMSVAIAEFSKTE